MRAELEGDQVVLHMSIEEAQWALKQDSIELKRTHDLGALSPDILFERRTNLANCIQEYRKQLSNNIMNNPDAELCIDVLTTLSESSRSGRHCLTVTQIAFNVGADLDRVIDVVQWFRCCATGVIFIDIRETANSTLVGHVDGDTKCYSTVAIDYWLYLLNSLDRNHDYAEVN